MGVMADPSKEVRVAVERLLWAAERQFDVAIAALGGPPLPPPPPTFWELWGRASRQLSDSLEWIGREIMKGYEHG